jgi:hypothetical protein
VIFQVVNAPGIFRLGKDLSNYLRKGINVYFFAVSSLFGVLCPKMLKKIPFEDLIFFS